MRHDTKMLCFFFVCIFKWKIYNLMRFQTGQNPPVTCYRLCGGFSAFSGTDLGSTKRLRGSRRTRVDLPEKNHRAILGT